MSMIAAIVEGTGLSVAPIVLRERGVYRAAWAVGKTWGASGFVETFGCG